MEHSHESSLQAWEANAEFWDSFMGDNSNDFHRLTVRPRVNELLDIRPDDFILDVACGNGNYSAYLAERGASVVAFDYSPKMIELAKNRRWRLSGKIEFAVADATDSKSLLSLKRQRPFTKAVSNMAVMDISEINTLFSCVNQMLDDDGIFVFATQRPCFVTLTQRYMTSHSYYGEAIAGQPREHCYYHRSLQDIFNACFKNGFVIDGFYEECFGDEKERPVVIIVRARKK